MLVPEADGGGSLSEHGLLDLVLVAEEMGRLVAPGPLVPGERGGQRRSPRAGSAEQKAAVLPGLLVGRGGGRVVRPDARRRRSATATGSCSPAPSRPVEAGAQAAHLLVTAAHRRRAHPACSCPADAAGVDGHARWTASTSCGASPRCASTACAVPAVERGRRRRAAPPTTSSASSRSPSCSSAPSRSAPWTAMFEVTLEYLGDRYSFGRPLSSYQALKHRVADDKMWLEACHAIATGAGRARWPPGPTTPASWSSAAKAWIGPARHRAHPGLRAAPRRHRRHLGARPAPLPAARHRRTGSPTARPRTTPSASPTRLLGAAS